MIRSAAGHFVATAGNGTIFRGSDDGSTWEYFSAGGTWGSPDVHGIIQAGTQPV